jgi:hypothetical protein
MIRGAQILGQAGASLDWRGKSAPRGIETRMPVGTPAGARRNPETVAQPRT